MIFHREVTMKKKTTMRFPQSRKGYDIDAVESYIALENAKCDEVQAEQRQRIADLKKECDELRSQIGVLKGREEQIKLAFVNATDNAEKLTRDVRRRYENELERLRLFRTKWTGAYEQLKERYHFDKDALNVESVAVNVEVELTKFLMQDFSLNKSVCEDEMEAHFRREIERLTMPVCRGASDEIPPEAKEIQARLKDAENRKKKDERTSVAFDINEALNPTDDINATCQALGLAK